LLIQVPVQDVPVLNSVYLSTLVLAISAGFTGWLLNVRAEMRSSHAWISEAGIWAATAAVCWWIGGGVHEIARYADRHGVANLTRFLIEACLLFAVATAWLSHTLRRCLAWPLAQYPALCLAPAVALCVIACSGLNEAPATGIGIIAWPVAFVAGYGLFWCQGRDVPQKVLAPLHVVMFWSLVGVLALECYWLTRAYVPEGSWSWAAWGCSGGLALLLLSLAGARLSWPVARFWNAYEVLGAAPIAAALCLWTLFSLRLDGSAAPLFWLPILNPLDVAQLLAALAVIAWLRRLAHRGIRWHSSLFSSAALISVFLWFNASLLRALHHWIDTPYAVASVLSSFHLQEVFLIGWSVFAFIGMWLAKRDSHVRLLTIAAAPLVLLMWLWTFYANLTQDGGEWSRWPLVNPMDLVQLVIFGAITMWFMRVSRMDAAFQAYRRHAIFAASLTLFFWLNTVLLRTLHHWAEVPYEFGKMMQSSLVQASLSVFWTTCALATMLWATRLKQHMLWFAGATLLAITVVKLFMFDLAHVSGIERIVSFIGVGLILLLIGYFAPLPPRKLSGENV
jgi:uncharacterized membrane protein